MKSIWFTVCVITAVACFCLAQAKSDERSKTKTPTADSMLGTEAGQVRDDNGLKMKLVWCPPGKFTMGSAKSDRQHLNDEKQADVTLTHGFWLGRFEVTQSEWRQVMKTEPWKGQDKTKAGDDFPATYVNWHDSMDFCGKLTERERLAGRVSEGWEYTLPTEAQWELGCRAGTGTRFSFGDDESKLGEYAWFFDNASNATENYAHRVGQKKPNPWGLCDMHGNVWEWCRDWYSDKLPGGRDPEVSQMTMMPVQRLEATEKNQRTTYELLAIRNGSFKVTRGGSWDERAGVSRSAARARFGPSPRNNYLLGFRVALSSVLQAKPDEQSGGTSQSTTDK